MIKKIEINTSQNVVIEYSLASIYDRILAFVLDVGIVAAGSTFIFLIYALFFGTEQPIAAYIIYVIPALTYNLILEIILNGQSIGKKVLRIKVIKLNGEKPNAFDFMMRWVFRLVDILFSFGILAVLMVTSTTRSQRFGDMLSDMVVIKINPLGMSNVEWILSRDKNNKYSPVYLGVKAYSEEEMLLIKRVSDRYTNYKNEGHLEVVDLLVKKIEEQLQIKAPQNKIEFLNQLIKDYVYLTR